jgi:hypothetical protein
MEPRKTEQDKIWIVTSDALVTRGSGPKQLKVEELAVNVNIFLNQMGNLLENTPERIGGFQFDEFEVHAEITTQGTIAVLGTGMQAGATGGLRFVFRRKNEPADTHEQK